MGTGGVLEAMQFIITTQSFWWLSACVSACADSLARPSVSSEQCIVFVLSSIRAAAA
jgi:hypothetical protein